MSHLTAAFELTVQRFSLRVELALDHGVLVLFGPSGAGKSLTVSALAGLIEPQAGRIEVDGRVLFDAEAGVSVPTRDRRVGYVPQHQSLFPFLDVAENVAFGLPKPRRSRDEPVVRELLDELELSHLERADVASLSGGERQRVAFARALAVRPQLLLLDEPFASIDQAGARRLRGVLGDVLRRHGTPTVLVTHDVSEAIALGDELVLFERGRTVRSGPPREVLGRGELVVSGRVREGGEADDEGLVTVQLTEATITGPASHLAPDEHGAISLRLPIDDD